MLASDVMDRAASFLNDSAKTIFTYAAQLPYLNMAIDDFKEEMENNNIAATNSESPVIVVKAGILGIGGGNGQPALPVGLLEIRQMWERTSGTSEDFVPMTKVEFLLKYTVQVEALIYWAWQEEAIVFMGATTDRDVKIDMMVDTIPQIVNSTDPIKTIRAKSFLSYRTAALCAQFIGENKTRADDLNKFAQLALDKFLNRNTKSTQAMVKRRKPFMAAYKVRGSF